ncbi:MAG: LysM peptidoglycan-binding domain-containing protein [Candidatus Methylomirabilales bacterium]
MWTLRASLVVLVSLAGIVPSLFCPDALAAAPAASQDVLHQVLPGDDLRLIAGYYFGDTRQWEVIWQANRDQVSNPNRIRRGTLLRIPDVTPPAEPYADFVARARRAQPSVVSPVKGKAAPGPAAETSPRGPEPPAAGAPGPAVAPGGPAQPPPTKRP